MLKILVMLLRVGIITTKKLQKKKKFTTTFLIEIVLKQKGLKFLSEKFLFQPFFLERNKKKKLVNLK